VRTAARMRTAWTTRPLSRLSVGSMRPDTLRRYLHRADTRALIASERKALLAWATSANPQALMNIRDRSLNDAARVRAALALEELEAPRQGPGQSPGFVCVCRL
jgi:hypothetical protein